MHKPNIYTIEQVNKYVKKILESDGLLAGIFVCGEMSNFKPHSSGHMYFTLKDPNAQISAVMFASSAQGLKFTPKNGTKVVAFGRLSMYEKTGQYQFYAEFMEEHGAGDTRLELEELRKKLEAEGLFKDKKPIPQFADTIAVITSPTGAAVRDIIKVIRQKNKNIKIVIVPVLVQGDGAPSDLIQALEDINNWGVPDVIIFGRGGGSAEDLGAFNAESVVRAVADSKIPVISGIGHETDTTLSDLAADLRAPTPSAAADFAAYNQYDLYLYVKDLVYDLNQGIDEHILQKFQTLKSISENLTKRTDERLAGLWQTLSHAEALLEKVSPFAAFKRGFGWVQTKDGLPVTKAQSLEVSQELKLSFSDGSANIYVKEIDLYEQL